VGSRQPGFPTELPRIFLAVSIHRAVIALQEVRLFAALREADLAKGSIQGIIIHWHFKPLFVNPAYAQMFGYTSEDIPIVTPYHEGLVSHLHQSHRVSDSASE
jgi:PAS domain-containing protein